MGQDWFFFPTTNVLVKKILSLSHSLFTFLETEIKIFSDYNKYYMAGAIVVVLLAVILVIIVIYK